MHRPRVPCLSISSRSNCKADATGSQVQRVIAMHTQHRSAELLAGEREAAEELKAERLRSATAEAEVKRLVAVYAKHRTEELAVGEL